MAEEDDSSFQECSGGKELGGDKPSGDKELGGDKPSGDKELGGDKPSDVPADPAADKAAVADDRAAVAADKAAVVTAAADGEAKKKIAEGDGKCELNCFSSALMVSGAVVATVAVGLLVTIKLKEK